MAANFPGCHCCIPSADPMLIQRDITDKGHDWGEITPKIYTEKGPWSSPLEAGYFVCAKCGLKAYALCSSKEYGDVETPHEKYGTITKFVRPPNGVELPAAPEKYILTWSPGSWMGDAMYKMNCDELNETRRWIATLNDDARVERAKYYYEMWEENKNGPCDYLFAKEAAEKYESMILLDEIYKLGAWKINPVGNRVTFVANMVAALRIHNTVGIWVDER